MNLKISKGSVLIFFTILLFATVCSHASDKIDKSKKRALEIEKGQNLTVEYGCVFCHSPKIIENDDLVPNPERLFSGHLSGNKLPDIPEGMIGENKWFGLYTSGFTAWGGPWGISYSANITPDKETGIGKWTQQDFLTVIRLGIHSNFKRGLMPPMPWQEINELSDENLISIFKYLKTIKPVKNKVPESRPLGTEK